MEEVKFSDLMVYSVFCDLKIDSFSLRSGKAWAGEPRPEFEALCY